MSELARLQEEYISRATALHAAHLRETSHLQMVSLQESLRETQLAASRSGHRGSRTNASSRDLLVGPTPADWCTRSGMTMSELEQSAASVGNPEAIDRLGMSSLSATIPVHGFQFGTRADAQYQPHQPGNPQRLPRGAEGSGSEYDRALLRRRCDFWPGFMYSPSWRSTGLHRWSNNDVLSWLRDSGLYEVFPLFSRMTVNGVTLSQLGAGRQHDLSILLGRATPDEAMQIEGRVDELLMALSLVAESPAIGLSGSTNERQRAAAGVRFTAAPSHSEAQKGHRSTNDGAGGQMFFMQC